MEICDIGILENGTAAVYLYDINVDQLNIEFVNTTITLFNNNY